jgi:hypothetical protein
LIPLDSKHVKIKSGQVYHELCAKEIAEAYLTFTINTSKLPPLSRKAQKKQKEEPVTEMNKAEQNDN